MPRSLPLAAAALLAVSGLVAACDGDDGGPILPCDATNPACVNGAYAGYSGYAGYAGYAGNAGYSANAGFGGVDNGFGGAPDNGSGGSSNQPPTSGISCVPGSTSGQCAPGTECCSSVSQCSVIGQPCPF